MFLVYLVFVLSWVEAMYFTIKRNGKEADWIRNPSKSLIMGLFALSSKTFFFLFLVV